jgi:hypothetical protein
VRRDRPSEDREAEHEQEYDGAGNAALSRENRFQKARSSLVCRVKIASSP